MNRILLDVDGVLADFHAATNAFLASAGGPHLPSNSWTLRDSLSSEQRVQWEPFMEKKWREPGFCSGIPMFPGSLEAVNRLRDIAEVIFVTAPLGESAHWMWERQVWLEEHLNADNRSVVLTHAKWVCQGDVLVDDKLSNLIEWQHHNPQGTAVLWDHGYAWNEPVPSTIVRTKSWDDVVSLLESL